MVYAHDSKSCSLTGLRVQVPPMAPFDSPSLRERLHSSSFSWRRSRGGGTIVLVPHFPVRSAVILTSVFLYVLSRGATAYAANAPVAEKKVIPGSRGVLMLSYPLRKGCNKFTTVRNITLLYDGTSPKYIRRVYASVLGKTLSNKRSINPENHTVTLWFNPKKAPGLCYSGSIDIYADFSNRAPKKSFHSLQVELTTDVITSDGSAGEPVHGPWVEIVGRQ